MSSEPGGDAAAAGGDNSDNNVWNAAHDASTQMILRSYVEDIESMTAKQQEELMQLRQKAAEQDAALKASNTRAEELQGSLQIKTEQFDKLKLEYQGASTKSTSLEETSKMDQERMDRLQSEGDKLRAEIR